MIRIFICLIATLVVPGLLAAGALPASAQPFGVGAAQREPSRAGCLAAQGGRYVFGQVSESGKDQFMLDTQTGRLWRMAESGKIGMFLKAVPYCNDQGECSEVPGDCPEPKGGGDRKK